MIEMPIWEWIVLFACWEIGALCFYEIILEAIFVFRCDNEGKK